MKPDFERRLDSLREEARANGTVRGHGVDVADSPIPRPPQKTKPGYAGEPIVRPHVWSWEISLYFYVGGATGMSAVLANPAWLFGLISLTRALLWTAFVGTIVSTVLLILDLGRPLRFLNMLRVFKPRSPMSVGSWILTTFGGLTSGALLTFELSHQHLFHGGVETFLLVLAVPLVIGAGFFGMLLATYTGVLIGCTATPAWHLHHGTLPIHFGTVGLGSAVSLMELFGFRHPALFALGCAAAAVETFLWIQLEIQRHGAADRAIHEGRSGWMIRTASVCTGPLSIICRIGGWAFAAALFFTVGGILSRFGWIAAGRASGLDPEAVLAEQRA